MSKRTKKARVWYVNRIVDRRRWRQELFRSELREDFTATSLVAEMFAGDDNARLILADYVEEKGRK